MIYLPIFNDESIYLQWALLFSKKFSYWSVPIIIDGKEPGYTMLLGIIFKILPTVDYLFIGRLISIIFGGITLIILNKIISTKYNDHRLIILLFLLTCPLFIFFSTLALAESLVGLLFLIIYYLFNKYFVNEILSPRLKSGLQNDGRKCLLTGFIIGIGWYIKTTIILVLIPIIVITLFNLYSNKIDKIIIFKKIILIIIGFIFTITPLLLNTDYQQSANIITRKSLSVSELISLPITIWLNNFIANSQYLIGYLTPPIFILLLIGSYNLVKQKRYQLLIWFYGPLLTIIFIAKITSVRYIYPILISFPLIAVEAFSLIKRTYHQLGAYFVIGLSTLISLYLLLNPLGYYQNYLKFFPAAEDDFSQYVTNWTSGYGVAETVDWLINKSKKQRILVFIRSDYGNPESAMYVYLDNQRNIKLYPVNLLPQVWSNLKKNKLNYGLYFVSRGSQYAGLEKHLVKKVIFNKPSGKEFIGIYRIK